MWKNHPIYKNYQANENGEIRCSNYKKIEGNVKVIKQTKSRNGYLKINVRKKVIPVHRFIWECFNGLLDKEKAIDHINTDRTDNRIENLKSCTFTENMANELTREHLRKVKSKLCGKKVLKLDKNTEEIIGWYPSISDAARKNGISSKNYIRWVCEGKKGFYTAGGFKWRYTDDYYVCKWGKWWITEGEDKINEKEETVSDKFQEDDNIILWKCKCSKKKYDFLIVPGRTKFDVYIRLKNMQNKEGNFDIVKKIKYAIKRYDLWKLCDNFVFTD